jgi:hypothetical protein
MVSYNKASKVSNRPWYNHPYILIDLINTNSQIDTQFEP